MGVHVFLAQHLTDVMVGGVAVLDGPEARHAAQVLRVRTGETIELVDGSGRRVRGRVISSARDEVRVEVDSVVTEPAPAPRLVVVQALAKGDRAERAVESLTEVGADVIVPWSAAHCVVRWDAEREDRGVERWRRTAQAAAKQARRAWVPEVTELHTTGQLTPLIAAASLALTLDEAAGTPITAYPIPSAGDVVVIVGPEGGISDAERVALADMGSLPARLGPTVLRASTAGTVATSILLSSTERWRHVRIDP